MTSHHSQHKSINVVGVSHLSDLYPNVKYKITMLQELGDARVCFYDLGAGSFYGNVSQRNAAHRWLQRCKFIWGHFSVLAHCLWRRGGITYVTYPAVFLLLGYSLLPRSWRPYLIMDAFLSLYDTAVNDRQLLAPSSLSARVLFKLEKRAFATADAIVVDTPDNGRHYSELFAIGSNKITAIPLSIPELPRQPSTVRKTDDGVFTCLFMGSLVPLQGISTLLKAIDLLQPEAQIRFEFIGDGQHAELIEDFQHTHPHAQLHWQQTMLATDSLIAHIADADLCLGIFGHSDKADRVLPYKLYYYAAMGKAFLSKNSPCLQSVADPLLLCEADAESLAARILELSRSPDLLEQSMTASRRLFDEELCGDVQRAGLLKVLKQAGNHN